MEPIPLTLTERILYLKKCAGSLRRLDKAAGLKPGYCHALVARIDDPHLSTLHKIADGAGVARSWVTNGDGPLPPAEGIRDAVAAVYAGAPDDDEADDGTPAVEPAPAVEARVIKPGLDPSDPEPQALAAQSARDAEDARKKEIIVKAMLARKAEREAAEAERKRVA